jgi:hypothetical protein
MSTLPLWARAVLGAVLMGVALGASAEKYSGKALIPWDAEGRVYLIGPDTLLFQGALEGIMYIESAKLEFDTASVRCPFSQELNLVSATTEAAGHCLIIVDGGDTAYAELSCSGHVGSCEGQFKVTAGTGRR